MGLTAKGTMSETFLQSPITMGGIKSVLRWLAVIPCSNLTFLVFSYPAKFLPVLGIPVTLGSFAAAVWVAATVAPAHKYKAALVYIGYGVLVSFAQFNFIAKTSTVESVTLTMNLLILVLYIPIGILVARTFKHPKFL
jgi:hypothetical protein